MDAACAAFHIVHIAKSLGSLPELHTVDDLLASANRKRESTKQLRPSQVGNPHIDQLKEDASLFGIGQLKESVGQERSNLHAQGPCVKVHQVQANKEQFIGSAEHKEHTLKLAIQHTVSV